MIKQFLVFLEFVTNIVFSAFKKAAFYVFVAFLVGVSIATTAFILGYNIGR